MFSEVHAQKAVDFFEQVLVHTKGEWAGKPFLLLPWQDDLLRRAFGTLREDGLRQYQTVYCEIPKKQGKSETAAGVALYLLIADGEEGAEVYGAAADRDQAGIVYNVAADMCRLKPTLAKRVKIVDSTKRIIYPKTRSYYRALSSETAGKHGYNVHGLIFDEMHVQPNRVLWDTLSKGIAARRQPLIFVITTAGVYDPNSICWELHEYARQVIESVIDDPSFLAVIYAADEKDDWTDPAIWRKANPSLGITVQEDYYRNEVKQALEVPAKENTFRRLFLNQWTRQETRWLPLHAWDECAGIVDEEELAGEPCWGGLDLASTTDIASLTLTFRVEDEYRSIWRLWCPEDSIEQRSRRDRVPYDLWQRQGHLIATSGNVIDFSFIRGEILRLAEKFNIQDIAYDRWGASQLSLELQDSGLVVVPFGQGYASMNAPTTLLLKLVLGKQLKHSNNPVVRWMADNLVTVTDDAGNVKPSKGRAREKIDGMVSLIMSLDRASRQENGPSVYETQGLTVL
jgi:phage terminase large subunit-like protein